MRKKIALLLIILLALSLAGCNYEIDTTFKYDYAILSLPNGEILEGEVEAWSDYEDGDQLQVKIDGSRYLVHSSNIVLINKGE